MATIMKKGFFCLLLLISSSLSLAHTIYAPNDIPLLDNRFRIDPHTEQVTFILNHSQGRQVVVLVRPDGSKIYYRKHSASVAWVSTKTTDIITIDNPMAGPWQALAELDGDNRIRLISHVELKTNRLPLKLYAQEYIRTHASLYYDGQLMTNKAYLDGAKLSIALIGDTEKKITLYQDNGQGYDALPFDGNLTARAYIDLIPGRYLLSIRTKNNVFIRNQNKDAVVFPAPITYKVRALEKDGTKAHFEFIIDTEEIDPKSVSIDGAIKDAGNNLVEQLIAHNTENDATEKLIYTPNKISYGRFTLSAKAFATTRSGREIELQLPDRVFDFYPPIPEISVSQAVATEKVTETVKPSIWKNVWVITALVVGFICIVVLGVIMIFIIRHKMKTKQGLSELTLDTLAPTNEEKN